MYITNSLNLKTTTKINVINIILFLIVCAIIYYELVSNNYLKRMIVLITLFYYAINDIKYALMLIMFFFLFDKNTNDIEHYALFDKKHREKIFNVVDDSIVKISNTIEEDTEDNEDVEDNEDAEDKNNNIDDLFGEPNEADKKTFSNELIDDNEESVIEPFVDLNTITGTFLKVGETIHNNNSLDKITKNIRKSARSAIKKIQEEDDEEDLETQEDKIKKQNQQYTKTKHAKNKKFINNEEEDNVNITEDKAEGDSEDEDKDKDEDSDDNSDSDDDNSDDESNDGTSACALSKTHDLRVDDGEGWKVPVKVIEEVEIVRDGGNLITFLGLKNEGSEKTESLPCYFKPGEGAERFKMYIKELKQRRIPKPPGAIGY